MPDHRRSHHYEVVPNAYRAARVAAGLKQYEVAIALGVHESYVSHIECGRIAFPEIDRFMDLCDLYGMDPWDLFDACYTAKDAQSTPTIKRRVTAHA